MFPRLQFTLNQLGTKNAINHNNLNQGLHIFMTPVCATRSHYLNKTYLLFVFPFNPITHWGMNKCPTISTNTLSEMYGWEMSKSLKQSASMMTSSNEKISALLAICAVNSPVTSEFPAQRPVTRRFDVSFDLRLNKRLSKQWWDWWFETPSRPLWRHNNESQSPINDITL